MARGCWPHALVFASCSLLLPCSGLRRHGRTAALPIDGRTAHWGEQIPEGEQVQPVGRHIQYLWMDIPKGMTDRLLHHFRPLVALGAKCQATAHIKGGALGPRLWLAPRHTEEVADSWDRYVDLQANGGNPFHELRNFSGCKRLSASELHYAAPCSMFDDGSLCVSIVDGINEDRPDLTRLLAKVKPQIPVSGTVRAAASSFLRRYGVLGAYGSFHIRRCDRLVMTAPRTALDKVFEHIAEHGDIRTWLIFTYTEEGYTEELRRRLAPLGVRLLFEDEVVLNEAFPKDNYFTYVVGKYLSSQADVIIETDLYDDIRDPQARSPDDVRSAGVWITRNTGEEIDWSAEQGRHDRHAAICDNRTRGASLETSNRGGSLGVA